MQQLRHMVKEGFVLKEHVDQIIVESDVTTLLDRVTLLLQAASALFVWLLPYSNSLNCVCS